MLRLPNVPPDKTLKIACAAKRIAVETAGYIGLVSVGSAIASFTASKRVTETDGQAQMKAQ